MSGDPDQEYFADGSSEDLITGLSRIRWLFVIARNSTFVYKNRAVTLSRSRASLACATCSRAAYAEPAKRLRITAQLVDAITGGHHWAGKYDRQLRDIFAVQDEMAWKDNAAFPKGIQIATLVGDPTKAGEAVVLRIKFPANFQMPPHTHPFSEVVTVISGTIGSTHGEKFEKKGEMLKPGSLWVYPAKHAHYAWTGNEEAILQVQFIGPGGIDYINPADDPRKK